jgi:hypothetical protein
MFSMYGFLFMSSCTRVLGGEVIGRRLTVVAASEQRCQAAWKQGAVAACAPEERRIETDMWA